MATFLMFGKYSSEAVKGISADRTEQGNRVIKMLGAKSSLCTHCLVSKIWCLLRSSQGYMRQ